MESPADAQRYEAAFEAAERAAADARAHNPLFTPILPTQLTSSVLLVQQWLHDTFPPSAGCRPLLVAEMTHSRLRECFLDFCVAYNSAQLPAAYYPPLTGGGSAVPVAASIRPVLTAPAMPLQSPGWYTDYRWNFAAHLPAQAREQIAAADSAAHANTHFASWRTLPREDFSGGPPRGEDR